MSKPVLILILIRNDGCIECTEPLDIYAAVTAEAAASISAAAEVQFRVTACGCDPSLKQQLAAHGYSVSAGDWSGGRAALHAL